MQRISLIIVSCFFCGLVCGQNNFVHGRLQVSPDKHYLQYQDGTPFFWLGDTGWGMFHFLSMDEMKLYLDNRAAKGFNVIQAVAIYDSNGTGNPNFYGDKAILSLNPLTPHEKYFALVDTVIRLAMQRNLFVALMPCWGDEIVRSWGNGTLQSDTLNAYTMGKYLGNRYKNFDNVIWMMGGDRPAQTDSLDTRPIWRSMARGIIEALHHRCLITYHPSGYRSSGEWLQNEPWLDFNMMQTSHGQHDAPTWDFVKKDRSNVPTKPTIDGEPNYEDHPVNPWPKWHVDSGYFRDYDVRKQLYRSVFAGALGVTYGHHAIWQFVSAKTEIINYADRGWVNAMDRPGAHQAGYLRKLIESRPTAERMPDLSIITVGQDKLNAGHMEAFRAKDNSYAMIYLPVGKTITINLDFMKATKINVWWFDPKSGIATATGTMLPKERQMEFTPPSTGVQNDWVLVIDDAAKQLAAPGK